ncbi:hypothetical protein H7J06_26005 [Mycobacterium hodleri]|uniref:hypothetical protein n=1 Tax=Mycolicibacterium hodleri TaxID=49897 RepID=UPI0021F27877|nr:hypothetical protein [Mycolicibacterium hodleri]MCV7136432.1 hypothetical protein [Mycolicibacterium hodleri]
MIHDSALIGRLDGRNERELYATLGAELLGETLGAGAQDDDEYRRFGQQWFEDRIDQWRQAICGTVIAKELSGEFPGDLVDVAALTLPLTGNNQLLALTIAAIILRRGVATLCAE